MEIMNENEVRALQDKVYYYEKQIEDMQAHIDCLKAELVEIQSNKLELPYGPIEVATMLIRATTTVKTTPVYRVFNPNAPDEHETKMYSKKDLREIAEHLLVYCNNGEDGD